jgi:hypothetical protein
MPNNRDVRPTSNTYDSMANVQVNMNAPVAPHSPPQNNNNARDHYSQFNNL